MRLVYGNAFMPINGATTTSRVRPVLASSGRPIRYVAQIEVKVWLIGNGQADLTAQENTLNAALLVPYQNLVLYQDTGFPTGTNLINPASISGVRVVEGPSYENDARDGEYVTQRTCRFVCEAEYVVPGAAAAMLSFTESVSINGTGGPVFRWRPLINAPPVRQIIYPASTVKATQAGSAVGHLGYPPVPPPLWPDVEMVDQRSVTAGSPRRLGQGFVEWPVQWRYTFEAYGPLVGLPSLPPL
ncbi:MAG: hypothetical protein JWO38_2348 [Gemmataceae bacterium]|nr:hypothetical protein [Gemmataceae bacterium]